MATGRVTKQIAAYIQKNQISVQQTALDLNISEKKLYGEKEENLTAAEFLDICSYLGICPEKFR